MRDGRESGAATSGPTNSEFLPNSIDSLYVFNARRAAPLIPTAEPGRSRRGPAPARRPAPRARRPARRPPGPRRTGPDRGHGPRTGADGAPLAARPADGRAAPHQQRRGAAARRTRDAGRTRAARRARGERARAGPARGRGPATLRQLRTPNRPQSRTRNCFASINLHKPPETQITARGGTEVRPDRSGMSNACEKRRFTLRRPRVGAVEDTHHTSTTGPGTARARVSRVAAGVHKSVHVSTSEFFLISSGPASRPCRAS